jgi:hypothetical protein
VIRLLKVYAEENGESLFLDEKGTLEVHQDCDTLLSGNGDKAYVLLCQQETTV